MKIVFFCDYFKDYLENRASFRIRYLTAQGICQKGHDVVFIYPEGKLNFVMDNVVVEDHNCTMKVIGTLGILPMRFRTGGFAFLDCLFKTMYVLTHRVDVIHVVSGHRPSNFIPCILGKLLKGCFTVDECWEWLGKGGCSNRRRGFVGKIISLYDNLLEIRLKELFDIIIVIATDLKDRFRKKEKVRVLFGGAENKNLHVYGVNEARDKLCLSKDLFIIGMSNLIPADHRENRVFFETFQRLCSKYSNMYLVATGTERAYVQEIETNYNVKGRIVFPGYVEFDKYNQYLSACNVFVLPYPDTAINRGRWPNKIGDYLCVKRPIITNPTGDVGRLLRSHRVGLLCDETIDGFYEILRRIIDKEIDLTYYTKDSLYVVNEKLSFDRRIESYLEIFEDGIKNLKSRT